MRERLGYRPALDGVRGIAILLVMGRHFYVPGISGGGHVGVQIFFVLSGFLITTLLLEEHAQSTRVSLGRFYVRRARRLLPGLFALLAMVLLVTGIRGELAESLPPAIFSGAYVANWTLAAGYPMGHLTHAWTLSVEEQFYMVWPLLLVVALGMRKVWAAAAFASIVGGLLIAIRVWRPELNFALDRADGLMIGCLLAMACASGWRLQSSMTFGVVSLAILLVAITAPYGDPTVYGWGLLVVGIASALLIAASLNGGGIERALSFRPLVAIGKISYSLYLWHFAVSWEVWPRLISAGWGWLPTAAASAALSTAFALVSYRYVERPLRARRRLATAQPATESEIRHAPAVAEAPGATT